MLKDLPGLSPEEQLVSKRSFLEVSHVVGLSYGDHDIFRGL